MIILKKKKEFIENIRMFLHNSFDEQMKYYISFFLNPFLYNKRNYIYINKQSLLNIYIFSLIHDMLLYYKNKNVWNYDTINLCISNFVDVLMHKQAYIYIQNVCINMFVYIINILFMIKKRNGTFFSLYFFYFEYPDE